MLGAAPTIPVSHTERPTGTSHVRRVAITVDPEIPVPPGLYGGIERIVDLLVHQLRGWGCEVLLFAHPESTTPASRLVPYAAGSSHGAVNSVRNMATVAAEVLAWKPQIIHSFARLAYLMPVLPWKSLPKVMSYQREITPSAVEQAERLARGSLTFTACSQHIMARYAGQPNWVAIYNAVPPERYDFVAHIPADAPLMFLGRVEEIKGPHLAIEIARRTGRRLILAGNRPSGEHHDRFFAEQVAPHIDNDQIRYIGPVNDAQKNEWLGQSAALLMPVTWEEPFGIVMPEALACGTPVVGLRRGAVPEVVEHGRTGFVGDTVDELVAAIPLLPTLDRAACRQAMEGRFSQGKIAGDYLRLYAQLIPQESGRA